MSFISSYQEGAYFSLSQTTKRMVQAVQQQNTSLIEKEINGIPNPDGSWRSHPNWFLSRTEPTYISARILLLNQMLQEAMAPGQGTKMFTFLCEHKVFQQMVQADRGSVEVYHGRDWRMKEANDQQRAAAESLEQGALQLFPNIAKSCALQDRKDCFEILCQKAHKLAVDIFKKSFGNEKALKAKSALLSAIIGTECYPLFKEKVMDPNGLALRSKEQETFEELHLFMLEKAKSNPELARTDMIKEFKARMEREKQFNEEIVKYFSIDQTEDFPLTDLSDKERYILKVLRRSQLPEENKAEAILKIKEQAIKEFDQAKTQAEAHLRRLVFGHLRS